MGVGRSPHVWGRKVSAERLPVLTAITLQEGPVSSFPAWENSCESMEVQPVTEQGQAAEPSATLKRRYISMTELWL